MRSPGVCWVRRNEAKGKKKNARGIVEKENRIKQRPSTQACETGNKDKCRGDALN